ncbi:glycosyltransferase family 4 protein [Demequina capsici]|uniref:Glycosyltransferase family 4 protein n=1 Tax=Demequina capsici TaxID=3075620 RepID=A0AA96F526_9MICO|nr:glycosyltransferase family 4 protein [Demequina sp. OYTSA14]WNM24201.1 glycosyltransferase family 4 protein [Demequina sp. OYTSA14]
MKIAMLLDDSMDRPDGVQQVVSSMGRMLVADGHEVVIVCSGGTGEPGPIPVVSLARNIGVSFNSNRLRTPRPARRADLRSWLLAERPDVIHVQMPYSPFFAGRLVREARRLLGDKVRIVGTFVILPDSAFSAFATRMLGLVLRPTLRLFDGFSALTEPAVEFSRVSFHAGGTVTPSPIDVGAFRAHVHTPRLEADGRPLTLSFLGRFVERKGAMELIEAIAALPHDVRAQLRVRMGGRGPLLGDAEALTAERGLSELVSFEGFVAEEDKPQFLADADIACFPATGGESFGIVLIEAMAAGAGVVIGGDNPGYTSTLGDPDAMIDARDTEAFAALITSLVRDPVRRAELHARQQERVKDFDSATVLKGVLELYGV